MRTELNFLRFWTFKHQLQVSDKLFFPFNKVCSFSSITALFFRITCTHVDWRRYPALHELSRDSKRPFYPGQPSSSCSYLLLFISLGRFLASERLKFRFSVQYRTWLALLSPVPPCVTSSFKFITAFLTDVEAVKQLSADVWKKNWQFPCTCKTRFSDMTSVEISHALGFKQTFKQAVNN